MESTATGGSSHRGLPSLEAGGVTRPRNAGRDASATKDAVYNSNNRIAPDVGSESSVRYHVKYHSAIRYPR